VDNYPILGATTLPGYFLATGLFRNGLLLAPIVAQAMADLITTNQTPALIAPFSIGRFAK
jgi:glycine oxidase